MTISKLRFFILAAMGATFQAGAADLLETYYAARGQDAVFAAARATQRAGQEKLPQGRSQLLPNVNLTANSTFNDNSVQYHGAALFRSGDTRYNNHGYGVSVVQPLFNQPKWLVYSESRLQVAQTEAQFKSTEQDLILRVAQAYFDV
ncbi:partial Outer membrane protein TolC, partial [Gallionellaceae bacterium]